MADSNVPFPNSPENTIQYDRKDAITDGMIDLLKPTVEEIDDRVKTVRESQVELRQQIDCLAEDLQVISGSQTIPVDLESYVKKLNNSRRRVMLVNNILQNVQERLTKLYNNVSRETARRKALLDPPGAGRPK